MLLEGNLKEFEQNEMSQFKDYIERKLNDEVEEGE